MFETATRVHTGAAVGPDQPTMRDPVRHGATVHILNTAREPHVTLAIWERRSPLCVPSLGSFADLCLVADVSEVGAVLGAALTAGPPADWHNALVLDVAMLAARLAAVADHDRIAIRLDRITGDACRRFHTDAVSARLITLRETLRVAASSPASVADPIQLSWAMRAFGGGPKPWGAALHALIEGGVPFTLTGPEKTNYIWISRAHIDRCCPRTQGVGLAEYSQRDALDVLNCGGRFAPRLATMARTGLGRTAWSIPSAKLIAIATGCVTAAELSARTGLHANVIARKLRAMEVPEALIG